MIIYDVLITILMSSQHEQIPCRTAMKGSFPLNGTYFQVNEVSRTSLVIFGLLSMTE